MKIKRLLALVLTLAMMLSVMVLPTSAASISFSDLKNYEWAEESIYRWAEAGIVSGDKGATTFRPGDNMLRGEFAKVMSETLGLSEEADNTFSDLKGTEWYAPYILRCADAGIMKGSDGKANAELPITRQEAFAMFARTMGMASGVAEDLASFKDADKLDAWAIPEAAAIVNYKAVKGDQMGNLNPLGNITRAEVVKILDRIVCVYANKDGNLSTTTASEVANAGNFVVVHAACADEVMVERDGTTAIASTDSASAEMASANGRTPRLVVGTQKSSVYYDEAMSVANGVISRILYLQVKYESDYVTPWYSSYSVDEYTYDANGNLLKKTSTSDYSDEVYVETAEFDSEGRLAKIFSNDVINSEISYDDQDRVVLRKVYSDGVLTRTFASEYGEYGLVKSTQTSGSDVTVTEYSYNDQGVQTGLKVTNNGVLSGTRNEVWDENGMITTAVDRDYADDGKTVIKQYERYYTDGRTAKIVDKQFDANGNVEDGKITTYAYDDDGNQIERKETDLNGVEELRVVMTYDDQDRCVKEETYRNGNSTPYSTRVIEYKSDEEWTETEYNANNGIAGQYHYTERTVKQDDGSRVYTYERTSEDGTYSDKSTATSQPFKIPVDVDPVTYWYAY